MSVFLCRFLNRFRIGFERILGPKMECKEESFLCSALKTEKRDPTAPVRADRVSGCPENA